MTFMRQDGALMMNRSRTFSPPPPLAARRVVFPEVAPGALDQDGEWCTVELPEGARRIRFHDYDQVYNIRGLYEHLFYTRLRCQSPEVVCGLLAEEMENEGVPMSRLRVLDVGAGNGMVGEELARHGVDEIMGVDIIEEARLAAERDRPDIYAEYCVADLTDLPGDARRRLAGYRFNGMTTVAALGFGDIPPRAFAGAFNLVETPGWIAFNIKETFLDRQDGTGFNQLIHAMIEANILTPLRLHRYCHRLSIAGEPLFYMAMVARKREDIPESMLTPFD